MPEDSPGTGLDASTEFGSANWPGLESVRIPGLTILSHPELERVGERAPLPGIDADGEALLSRLEPAFAAPGPGGPGPRPLADRHLSRTPLRLSAGAGRGSVLLDCRSTRTAVAVDGEGLTGTRQLSGAELDRGVALLLGNRVALLLHRLDPVVPPRLPRYGLIGDSAPMVELRRSLGRVADLDLPVLLRGETGTGKELVARALHDASGRRSGPFVAVNLAAVPPSLAAAELFGVARGAFTGADRTRIGFFRQAHGGTLFLDEVGETPSDVQPLLLRALEAGEVQPVGDEGLRRVDVRVVSATDADLDLAITEERFRAPLLHRLAGFTLRLPPLRERRDDFGRLFVQFLAEELRRIGEERRLHDAQRPWIPAALMARLVAYDWPGNVRQLRNAVRQLVILHREAEGVSSDLPLERLLGPALTRSGGRGGNSIPAPRAPRRPSDVREDELVATLRANRWRLQATADHLGIPRSSLYDLIARSSRVRKATDLGREEIERRFEASERSLEKTAEALEVSEAALLRRMRSLGMEI